MKNMAPNTKGYGVSHYTPRQGACGAGFIAQACSRNAVVALELLFYNR